jgi:hypothetical protein
MRSYYYTLEGMREAVGFEGSWVMASDALSDREAAVAEAVEKEREIFEMGFLEGLEAREPWRQWTDAEIRAISVRRIP